MLPLEHSAIRLTCIKRQLLFELIFGLFESCRLGLHYFFSVCKQYFFNLGKQIKLLTEIVSCEKRNANCSHTRMFCVLTSVIFLPMSASISYKVDEQWTESLQK